MMMAITEWCRLNRIVEPNGTNGSGWNRKEQMELNGTEWHQMEMDGTETNRIKPHDTEWSRMEADANGSEYNRM